MRLIDEIKNLRELEQQADQSTLGWKMLDLAPAMLSVLECFRKGDAEAIQEIIDGLRYAMERAVPIDPGNMEPLLKRLQKAASLMEQEREG